MSLLHSKLKTCLLKAVYIIALMLFCPPIFAQVISGVVLKAGTNTPIPAAIVYFKGFSESAATDEQGKFEIQAKPAYTEFVISCTGYQSLVLNIDTSKHTFYLLPKTQQLKEVVIVSDGLNKEEKLKLFNKEFLGNSKFANNCRILNPDDLSINYNKTQQTLKAFAYAPLLIENKDLGYAITYELDSLISSPEKLIVVGNYTFNEVPEISAEIIKNREEAYRGSKMHFVRALANKQLNTEGFKATNRLEFLIAEQDLLLDSAGQHYLKFPGKVFITHRNKRSVVYSTMPRAILGSDGYFDTALIWMGQVARSRVADMLPYSYKANEIKPAIARVKPDTLKKSSEPLKKLTDTLQLKEVEVRANRTLVLRDGWPYHTFGKAQVLDVLSADSTYKTLEWYILQKLKGARTSTSTNVTGIVFAGRVSVNRQMAYLDEDRVIEQKTQGEAIPLLFVNGKELNMQEPAQAEYYRNQYFNMPIIRFKKIVLQQYVGTNGDRYVIFLTLR